jgi:hypothetical protein
MQVVDMMLAAIAMSPGDCIVVTLVSDLFAVNTFVFDYS